MKKFRLWLVNSGLKQRAVASRLNISLSSLHAILRCNKTPSLKVAYAIDILSKGQVGLYDWLELIKLD